jgi:hypothetical protein
MIKIIKKILLILIVGINFISAHAQAKAIIEIDSAAGHIFIH